MPDESKKALIAMSGGVDSSIAAALTIEAGFDCVGVTMKLYGGADEAPAGEGTCCSLSDVEDARSVAYRLGMKYYVFNFTEGFDECVIRRFIDAYERGVTPNPCIDCNRYMKFAQLYRRARELGRGVIVTGHYARTEYDSASGRWLLKKAKNLEKDQSYVLYFLSQDQLAHTRFPLGSFTSKEEVRALAARYGFVNAAKRDSQDICFVPDRDYAGFIERRTGRVYPHGDFVDTEGRVLGEHKGMIRYTVGQRKGLGLALPAPMYVCRKDMENNRVVLCGGEGLFTRELIASDFNWIAFETPPSELRACAKARYSAKEAPALVRPLEDGRVSVVFDQPQRALTEGQAVVLYDGDVVIGGGTITEVRRSV